jgi:tetratricopeptide (TPR) repeat protein
LILKEDVQLKKQDQTDAGEAEVDQRYLDLIHGNTRGFLKDSSNTELKKEETAFLGLVQAVRRNARVSDELLKSITQEDLDGFSNVEKGMYFEGIALNLASQNRSSEAVNTLCHNALLHWEKAFFARRELARQEAKRHPQKSIEIYEDLLKYYPDDPESLFAIARLHLQARHKVEAVKAIQDAPDKFRKGLYTLILDLFTNWAMYTLMFVLLILLVYTPIVSLIFFILAGGICVALMLYAVAKKDPLIFNFFFSAILIVTVLFVVKWLFLK